MAAVATDRAQIFTNYKIIFSGLLIIGAAATLAGCSMFGGFGSKSNGEGFSPRVVKYGEPVPKGGGRYKIGSPYKIGGEWYRPHEDARYDRVGTASWYGAMFHGRYTANGEVYDMDALTAAHPTLPMPVYAKVTNLSNGRSLVVRINDRGPYAHNRVIDLSRKSATLLGFRKQGTARVRVQYLGRAPLNGDDRYERHYLAQQRWHHNRYAAQKQDYLSVGTISQTRPTAASVNDPYRQPVFIKAGMFKNPANAQRLKTRLSAVGPAHMDLVQMPNGPLYRVTVGPYHGGHSAQTALQNVVNSGVPDAEIIGRYPRQ